VIKKEKKKPRIRTIPQHERCNCTMQSLSRLITQL